MEKHGYNKREGSGFLVSERNAFNNRIPLLMGEGVRSL